MNNDWVCETLLGMRPGYCGTLSGCQGMVHDSRGQAAEWYYCDWCGEKRDYSGPAMCPSYLLPEVTLQQVMEALGSRDDGYSYAALARYDPFREAKHWTVMLSKVPREDRDLSKQEYGREDTDDPLKTLIEIARRLIDD